VAIPWFKKAPREQVIDLVPGISPELRSVLNALDSISIVLSASDQVLYSSHEASRFGIIRDGRISSQELMALVRVVRRTHKSHEGNLEIPSTVLSGASSNLRVRVAPLDQIGRTLVLVDDVSEAQRVDAIRRDFVANISHELKTPIGALSLLSEAVAGASDNPELVKHFATKMGVTSHRLTELVQQIINLSRLQDANPLQEYKLVQVSDVVNQAIALCITNAESRNISLDLDLQEECFVFADREQLVMAIQNLIENAINYSPQNTRVNIAVRLEKRNVEIIVKDQGIGIPDSDLERIFERFYRVDPARSRETGGTGLGLSIVKHVAANHGGEVRVWSKPDEGSTFTFVIPKSESNSEQEAALFFTRAHRQNPCCTSQAAGARAIHWATHGRSGSDGYRTPHSYC
jgi:two-component system sensor histidine kinase SenX3